MTGSRARWRTRSAAIPARTSPSTSGPSSARSSGCLTPCSPPPGSPSSPPISTAPSTARTPASGPERDAPVEPGQDAPPEHHVAHVRGQERRQRRPVHAGSHGAQQPVLAALPHPARRDGDPGHLGGGEQHVNAGVTEQYQRDNALFLVRSARIGQVCQEPLLPFLTALIVAEMAAHAPIMRTGPVWPIRSGGH